MSTLEKIIDRGNRTVAGKRDNWIECADGFKLSVVATHGAYCTPRPAFSARSRFDDEVLPDYPGPYTAVEVGYPTVRPEPYQCSAWHDGYDSHDDHPVCDGWIKYGDGDEYGNASIYGYVPVDMVRALVALHGGEKS